MNEIKQIDSENSVRFNGRMLILLGLIYPAWSIYLHYFQPHELDDPWGRVAVGALALSCWLLQKLSPKFRSHSGSLVLTSLIVLSAHFHWLIYRNSLSDIYIFGSAVVAAGSSAMFERTRQYLIYYAWTISLALWVTVLLYAKTPKASMFFIMILTIQTIVYFSLSARFSALKHLKEARESNLEMRRQLLERELEEAKSESAHFKQMSLHDKVTDLPNRTYLDRQIHQSLDRYFQEGIPFTLLFIDLDKFKAVNDTHGHETGDQVLRAAAHRIRSSLRRSDMVGRIGGDEFIAVLAGVDDPVLVSNIVNAIEDQLAKDFDASGVICSIGASVGHAICPKDASIHEQLVKIADQSMYDIKRRRKARDLKAA